jgi:hypothetical protein
MFPDCWPDAVEGEQRVARFAAQSSVWVEAGSGWWDGDLADTAYGNKNVNPCQALFTG